MPELLSAAPDAMPSTLPPAAVILLGRDDTGRPHASRFDPSEAGEVASAASLMGMHMLPVADDDLDRIARQLPKGRVFASGKAFVPFVGQGLYDKLVERLPTSALTRPPRATPLDGASVASGAGKGSPASPVAPVAKSEPKAEAPAASLDPSDAWSRIKAGDVVLALDASEGGWFEAHVVEIADDEFLKLRWRDYPEEAHFLRRRWNVGLLHPKLGRP